MKKLCFLILLLIAFVSCDGKYKAKRSHIEALKENNLYESFSEELKFIPKQYLQIKTDTILDNGINIKIDYHSIENSFIIKATEKDKDTVVQIHYKNFEALIQLSVNGQEISKRLIDKAFFYTDANKSFLDNAIMQYVWIDYNSVTKNSVQLNTTFILPETEKFKDFVITVYDDGSMSLKEINLDKNAV
ncbi:hypothetical protein KO566_13600 [Flavobacteriaceae bacterium XHP0103]|uniref:hypothetical protein n=1 Tax=Marixanthotalea marina TaxID=2844359 RepID=UPI002989CAB8|nr:hypothetical protein [Marixanthotalea marina]MBU3823093.1 hypothetical protein [Marixanthotalea marina]